MRRRHFLAAAASIAALPGTAHASGRHYELRDIAVPGSRRVGRRFTLLAPKTTAPVPLLVCLHGLGETHDERMGAFAWVERYGLGDAYDRLCSPPIKALGKHWTEQGLAAANAKLQSRPFGGMAIACPYTPNVYKASSRTALLDDYANWLVDTVIPRARNEVATLAGPSHTGLDGCSLGGYVGIEVFLRKPETFGAWGSVQGALGAHRIERYAQGIEDVIATHGKRRLHLETSSADAFRKVNEQLAKKLRARHIEVDFTMPPGPHNQPFLRDSGSLEMLLWHDRALR